MYARRAERLAPTLPASVPAGTIGFDSGHAFPGVLPDLTREAEVALTRYRAETLQYAPRPGLPDLYELLTTRARSRLRSQPVLASVSSTCLAGRNLDRHRGRRRMQIVPFDRRRFLHCDTRSSWRCRASRQRKLDSTHSRSDLGS